MPMKRWGLQYLNFTSWMYCFMWIGYLVDSETQGRQPPRSRGSTS
jgi:hypothetical protein